MQTVAQRGWQEIVQGSPTAPLLNEGPQKQHQQPRGVLKCKLLHSSPNLQNLNLEVQWSPIIYFNKSSKWSWCTYKSEDNLSIGFCNQLHLRRKRVRSWQWFFGFWLQQWGRLLTPLLTEGGDSGGGAGLREGTQTPGGRNISSTISCGNWKLERWNLKWFTWTIFLPIFILFNVNISCSSNW